MICRSQRSAKSAAWSSENVVGVSNRRCFPRRVADFTSGDEFHSVKCKRNPPISSQRLSKYSCVLLPDPSVPSTTINAPGYARLGIGRPGCGSVDFVGSVRGAFCVTSRFSMILELLNSQRLIPHCYRGITTHRAISGKAHQVGRV